MPTSESTCWTVIKAGTAGSKADRDEVGRRYLGVVRAYLSARWRGSELRKDLDDATQEVSSSALGKVGRYRNTGTWKIEAIPILQGFAVNELQVIESVVDRVEYLYLPVSNPLGIRKTEIAHGHSEIPCW